MWIYACAVKKHRNNYHLRQYTFLISVTYVYILQQYNNLVRVVFKIIIHSVY